MSSKNVNKAWSQINAEPVIGMIRQEQYKIIITCLKKVTFPAVWSGLALNPRIVLQFVKEGATSLLVRNWLDIFS